MSGRVWYNEFDKSAADYLENLIAERLIPRGVVDRRSIADVQPEDLKGFIHCHFFAGIGGWALSAELAGWPLSRPLWTGSCPCQPFSLAGQKLGADDHRHLWPDFFRLVRACRPPVVVGEQVAGALGLGWFDGVRADLGGEGYACRACDIPAAAMDSPQIRQRLWWVAVPMASGDGDGRQRGPERDLRPVEPGQQAPRRDHPDGCDVSGGGGEAERGRALASGDSQRLLPSRPDGAFGGPAGGSDTASMAGAHGRRGPEVGARHEALDVQRAGGPRDGARGPGPRASGATGPGEGGPLVDASGERRGERRAEPELWSGRPAITGADAPDRPDGAVTVAGGDSSQRDQGRAAHDGQTGGRIEGADRSGGRDASRGPSDMAGGAGEHGGELQPLGGPEGRTAAAGDDAGERPATGVVAGADGRGRAGHGERGQSEPDDAGGPDAGERGLLGHGEVVGGGAGLREDRPERHGTEPADAGRDRGRPLPLGRAARWGLAFRQQPTRLGGPATWRGDAAGADVPNGSWWSDHSWIVCHDDKGRRVPEPRIPLLVTGVQGGVAVLRTGQIVENPQGEEGIDYRWVSRVGAWKGFGNAISPILGAQVLGAILDG